MMDTAQLSKTSINKTLSSEELNLLNQRSNLKGLVQLTGHLTVMVISCYLWVNNVANSLIAIPALIVYGFSLASMFAPMHECVHRTAFANNRLNDIVAWFAGLLSFYNSTFYRRYHKWHHKYTQLPDKDPELSDPKPSNFREYFLEITALPWWLGKLRGHFSIALGNLDNCPYIPETARVNVIRSTRIQLVVYAIAIALSFALKQPLFLLYWLLPLAIGQPILRAILLAEHTGCSNENNSFTNTRTTLTIAPLRLMMWNMPFHAEHHLYASIPFHALPATHEKLKTYWHHLEKGYLKVNQNIINNFRRSVA